MGTSQPGDKSWRYLCWGPLWVQSVAAVLQNCRDVLQIVEYFRENVLGCPQIHPHLPGGKSPCKGFLTCPAPGAVSIRDIFQLAALQPQQGGQTVGQDHNVGQEVSDQSECRIHQGDEWFQSLGLWEDSDYRWTTKGGSDSQQFVGGFPAGETLITDDRDEQQGGGHSVRAVMDRCYMLYLAQIFCV